MSPQGALQFPFLFGGTFIEGTDAVATVEQSLDFPSFSEGLSLREVVVVVTGGHGRISLPFRRDFH